MNKTTARIIQISDLLQWNDKDELELSPKYQRNSVWNETAKAYLIDTIVRGLPIPPIFLRQKVDVVTRKTFREVIDGQQRIRAILEYIVEENYAIKRSHNKELGGKTYSDLDDDIKESILQYEILAEIVTEKDDSVIYDMFARLNSNNIVLNKQEIRNSKYWGEYKVFIYQMASKYRGFFSDNGIFNDKDFSRMKDAELINSLAILFTEGVRDESPTFVDEVYEKYDKAFPLSEEIEEKMDRVFSIIERVFLYLNGNISCFKNKNYFYTMFASVAHIVYGLDNISVKSGEEFVVFMEKNIIQFIHDYERAIDKNNTFGLQENFNEFIKYHKSRTTSKAERISRIEFLVKRLECDE